MKSAPAIFSLDSYISLAFKLFFKCKCGGATARLINFCSGIIFLELIIVLTSATVSPIYAMGGADLPSS